jgi:hypothetical protein
MGVHGCPTLTMKEGDESLRLGLMGRELESLSAGWHKRKKENRVSKSLPSVSLPCSNRKASHSRGLAGIFGMT